IIIVGSFLDRFPPDRLGELRRSGVAVRVIADPSTVTMAEETVSEQIPCAGKRVLVAGNGELVGIAGSIFEETEELVVVASEGRTIDALGRCEEASSRCDAVYLGSMDDRRSLGSVLERHRPEVVFVDLALQVRAISNPIEGYLRTVLFPVERLASSVLRVSGTHLVAVNRNYDSGVVELKDAGSSFEIALRDIFRHEPDRLTILRLEHRSAPVRWRTLLCRLIEVGGGIYRAAARSEGKDPAVEKVGEPFPLPETGTLFIELTRYLDGGDTHRMAEILREMAGALKVEEHGY
ncbi:MAG: hypothetical protein KAX38_03490, partial [Candidatus Krumholzibacteria bacterium]|nr:hypothetical protein [Candidatus Krumholzibacteria bacterium]